MGSTTSSLLPQTTTTTTTTPSRVCTPRSSTSSVALTSTTTLSIPSTLLTSAQSTPSNIVVTIALPTSTPAPTTTTTEYIPTKVLSDLTAISVAISSFSNAVSAFSATPNQDITPIEEAEGALRYTLSQAASDASAASSFGSVAASSVVEEFNAIITGSAGIVSLLQQLEAASSAFFQAGYVDEIRFDIESESSEFDSLISAFVPKAPAAYQTSLSAADSSIDSQYGSAIAFFS